MRKIYSICILLLFISLKSIAQSPALRGLYVDSFDEILGDATKESQLLNYAKDSSFNYLALYGLSGINLNNSSNATSMAAFISNARNNYGVAYIGAVTETSSGITSRIVPYNNSRSNNDEKFNVFNMEFEFWTNSSVTSGGYYCTQYLQQANCSCDTSGAFKYFIRELHAIDSLAATQGAISETYVGWFNQGQGAQIVNNADRILLHAYRTDETSLFGYSKTRLEYLASNGTVTEVAAIFSSEDDFMGPWLESHSLVKAWTRYKSDYDSYNASWKQYINLTGYHWFVWRDMPQPSGTPPPLQAIITPSGSPNLCTGKTLTLTASAGSSYQWSNGATTQSITVSNAGSFSCAITINGVVHNTSPLTVTLKSIPTVTTSTTTLQSGAVLLSANASAGSGSIASYQWAKDNTDIQNADASSYTATASGDYTVLVSNTYGCTKTSAAENLNITSQACVASVPAGLITGPVQDVRRLLSWDAGQTGDSIVVRYKDETHNGNYEYIRMPYTGQTSVMLTDLLPETEYSWRVKMICGSTAGNYSVKEFFTTGPVMSIHATLESTGNNVFRIFPSVASENLAVSYVSNAETGPVIISLIDAKGSIVLQQSLPVQEGENNMQISLSTIENGSYFLRMQTNDQVLQGRCIVMH